MNSPLADGQICSEILSFAKGLTLWDLKKEEIHSDYWDVLGNKRRFKWDSLSAEEQYQCNKNY